jgi:hypothetical protein
MGCSRLKLLPELDGNFVGVQQRIGGNPAGSADEDCIISFHIQVSGWPTKGWSTQKTSWLIP